MAHDYVATYTNKPATNEVDFVRLTIGDTDCVTVGLARLSDAEINFRINEESSRERAAWRCCQDIISKLTGTSADFGIGTQRKSKSQTLDHYRKLEKELRTRGAGEFAAMIAGGLSHSEKEATRQDTDLIQGQFRTNRFRNHRIGHVHGNDDHEHFS